MSEVTRRQMLGATGTGALGLALGGGGYAVGRHVAESAQESADETIPFHGTHQAGIVTPAQDRLVFGAFDLTIDSAAELREMLRAWTDAAEKMTAGQATGPIPGPSDAPPSDTGEAIGLGPARLTITFGFGAGVFERDSEDRFGLAARSSDQRGRHLRAGLCQRPPGGVPRGAQSGASGARIGRPQMGTARLRSHVLHNQT